MAVDFINATFSLFQGIFNLVLVYFAFWWNLYFISESWFVKLLLIFSSTFSSLIILSLIFVFFYYSIKFIFEIITLIKQTIQKLIEEYRAKRDKEYMEIEKFISEKDEKYLNIETNVKKLGISSRESISDEAKEIYQVIKDFKNHIERNHVQDKAFFDEKILPHPKNKTVNSLLIGINAFSDGKEKKNLEDLLIITLPYFQKNIGENPIYKSSFSALESDGLNLSNIDTNDKGKMEEYISEFKKKNKENKKKISTLNKNYISEAKQYTELIK